MSKTHYEVLGVNELAGDAKIKRHYYELCKKYHPDVAGGDSQKMIAINEAYRVLSDSTLKSGYDRELAATRREAAFAQTAQRAKAQQAAQTTWHDVAFEQQEEPTVFRRAAQTAKVKKKHTGMAWFISVSGIVAVALIAISYLAPFPQAATAGTSTTPSVATTDAAGSADQTTDTSTTSSSTTDPNAQAALDTLQSDTPSTTTPTSTSASSTPSSSTSSTTQQTQSTHKHRHPFSFWLPQTDN